MLTPFPPRSRANTESHKDPIKNTMPASQSPCDSRSPQPTVVVPGPSTVQLDITLNPWMVVTTIEDDDLMFGGKPLSTWYEEERRRQSLGSGFDHENRGRTRERAPTAHLKHDPRHPNPHHHHHHETKAKDTKP